MEMSDWVLWAILLFSQQFTFLFSGRAKNSGSLKYSALAGIGSHGTWFFAQVFFIPAILTFVDASIAFKAVTALFYMTFCILGTVSAQVIALRWAERGKMMVGAR